MPLVILALRTGRLREVGKTAVAAALTWLAVNLPILVLFPRGWSEFFRLNTRRGDDMDSLYNVVKSFTGWRGFDRNLRFWEPPTVLNAVVGGAVRVVLRGNRLTSRLTAPRRPRLAQLAFLVVAAFLLTNKVWSPQYSLWLVPLAVLALPHRRILLAWMTIDALVWVPRMLYLYGEQNEGLPEQWFTDDRAAARHRGDGVVRVGGPPDLPARAGPGPRSRRASTTRRVGCSTTRPTRRRAGCRRGCGHRCGRARSVRARSVGGSSAERDESSSAP